MKNMKPIGIQIKYYKYSKKCVKTSFIDNKKGNLILDFQFFH